MAEKGPRRIADICADQESVETRTQQKQIDKRHEMILKVNQTDVYIQMRLSIAA